MENLPNPAFFIAHRASCALASNRDEVAPGSAILNGRIPTDSPNFKPEHRDDSVHGALSRLS
jgi:hypothetical protein